MAVKVKIPEWCKQGGWVFYAPTQIVFQAARLQIDRRNDALYLIDANGRDYPVNDCRELSLADLKRPAQLIWPNKPPARLLPAANGFLLTGGQFQKKVIVPDEHDQAATALAAAQSLANFFNGVIYSDEED